MSPKPHDLDSPTLGHSLDRRLDAWLAAAKRRLRQAKISTREATTLVTELLGLSAAQVMARGETLLDRAQEEILSQRLESRLSGEPLAYVLGKRGFYGRDFYVDARVLIPRPETEHLVEAALALVLPTAPRIVDVGTGSGCIAVTLACELPSARLTAVDVSTGALEVARQNSRHHGVDKRMCLVRTDLLAGIDLDRVDLIVSNPPYVADDGAVADDVRAHEPHVALFADDHGRDILKRLLDAASGLRSGCHLLLEIGYDQGEWLEQAVDQRQNLGLVEVIRDYSDHPRTAVIVRN